jgi:predicted permease
MISLRELFARIFSATHKTREEDELNSELAAHLEIAIEENKRAGMSGSEARRIALVGLGGMGPAKDLHRDARGLPSLESILQDLGYAARVLRRDAAFTIFAVLIIAFGVAASATVFSVLNALLIRPLPFHDPDRLVWIYNHDGGGLSGATTQVGHLLDLRDQNHSFSDIAGYMAFYGVGDSKLTGSGEPERISGVPVSGNFFQLLGVRPQMGRMFSPDECKWNGPNAVMLSHGLWVRRFASDPLIVGRAININEQPYNVVGVLPASFDFGEIFAPGTHIDLYFPFPLSPETNRWGNTMAMIGRLKPGATVKSAQAEFKILAATISRAHPERNDLEAHLNRLNDHVSGRMRPALLVLACAVAVVMLIVCANLSNLLLARNAARRKEIAIRTALGAGRGRLIRQLLTESLVLSGCGAALGLILAVIATRAVSRLDAFSIPMLADVRTDWTVIGFTILVAIVTGLVFGLAPALHSPTAGMNEALKDSSRGSTESKAWTYVRGALVVSEVAFACVLLVGAGLLIRSFLRVLDVNVGFRPEHAIAVRVDPGPEYKTPEQRNAYYNEVLRRIKDVPGTETAGLTDALPLGRNRGWGAAAKGHVYPKGQYPDAFVRIVSDGYLGAMGIALRDGRDFTPRDMPSTEPVIIVNETMARSLWPGENAIGKLLSTSDKDWRVVGIAGDVRHLALEEGSGNEMYLPIRQCDCASSVDLVVRSTIAPQELAPAIRAALKPIEPNLPSNDFRPLQQLVDKSVSPRRFVVWLLGGFALFALVLASLGIYGVISYSVSQRTQEIGIRMALGATAGELQGSIIRQALGLAAIGMLVGAAASLAVTAALRGLVFGVTATDPITFMGMLVAFTVVATLAGYLPARRASRIDPMVALRAT